MGRRSAAAPQPPRQRPPLSWRRAPPRGTAAAWEGGDRCCCGSSQPGSAKQAEDGASPARFSPARGPAGALFRIRPGRFSAPPRPAGGAPLDAESLHEWPGQNGATRPSGARLGTLFRRARIRLSRATLFLWDASVCCNCTYFFFSLALLCKPLFFFFGPREAMAGCTSASRAFANLPDAFIFIFFIFIYFFGLDRVQKQKKSRGKMLLFFWRQKQKQTRHRTFEVTHLVLALRLKNAAFFFF